MILEFISDWVKIGPSSLTFSFVFRSKVLSSMADFAFVIEVSGFQHGDLLFYLKRLSIAPVRAGSSHSITFNADFLRDHDERALSTYRFATTTIHGIDLHEPVLAYDLRYDAVQSTLKHLLFTSQRRLQAEYQNAMLSVK